MTKRKDIDPRVLIKLITWFDGYSALRTTDPLKIERTIKKHSEDTDLNSVWREVKSDVYDIANLPSSSPEITKLAKRLNYFRLFFMVLGPIIFILLILISRLGYAQFGPLGPWIPIILFFAIYFGVFFLHSLTNRRLNLLVRDHYQKHAGGVAKQRRRIKQASQRLIDRLASYIRSHKYEPDDYRFNLLHSDYGNLRILEERELGEGKSKSYLVAVKARTAGDKSEY